MQARIGVDLGGTKIEVIAFDPQGNVLVRERLATPAGDYKQILSSILTLVRLARQHTQPFGHASIGIGIPGSLSPANQLVRNANSTALNGRALQADLEQVLDQAVRLENDANCLAMSEGFDGAAKGAASVFAVILGTGTGAGVVVNGRIVSGHNRLSGEWGHNRMAVAQDPTYLGGQHVNQCWCGRKDCYETWLSGPGMAADYSRVSGGQALAPQEIVLAARAGDEIAGNVLQAYCHRLAFGLAQIINLLDPEVIVLGGGMSNIRELYERVPLLWQRDVFSDVCTTRLVPSQFGDSSGVRGAAWLWN
jgi:fructokinase